MELTKEEIKSRNESIATMLGWFREEGQPQTWFKSSESAKYVVYSEYKDQFKELPFHKDWNYLMQVKDFIEKDGVYTVTITSKSTSIFSVVNGTEGTDFNDCLLSAFVAFSDFAKHTYKSKI